MTLWYGMVLCLILILFSSATYLRYRAAAWRAFDTDLRNNLDALQSALLEEITDANRLAPVGSDPAPARDPLKQGATQALEEFRLSGLYAEIRAGRAAETLLARIPGAGLDTNDPLLSESVWRQAALSRETRSLPLTGGRHAIVRSVRFAGEPDPVTLAVAGRTILVEDTLASIRLSLFEFGTAGLILAIAGGYWLATRALRPIDVMTGQASRMAGASLSREPHRLDVQNTEDELGRLAMTFNQLLERIESSLSQTKDFIADAAHELKTPVSIVRAEAELSLSGERGLEEYRDALRTIVAESGHLSNLVTDLTLLAEGETLGYPLERRLVDLNELVHEVARSLRSVAASREIAVEIESSGCAEYRGDERLLRQIAINLLENAIKFSPAGSRIGVALSEEPDGVELRVLDQAPTLSEADKARVFERFYRSQQARGAGATGSGLGLAIVQWAVRLHGGRVRVEPRAQQGNAFIVEFPQAPEPSAQG